MEQTADSNDGYGFDLSSNYISQPPQIFGAYNPDGSPVPPVLSGSIFGDGNEQGSVDENDPKRRRIARVSGRIANQKCGVSNGAYRLAICVERRRYDNLLVALGSSLTLGTTDQM
jgi:hypothetical protein